MANYEALPIEARLEARREQPIEARAERKIAGRKKEEPIEVRVERATRLQRIAELPIEAKAETYIGLKALQTQPALAFTPAPIPITSYEAKTTARYPQPAYAPTPAPTLAPTPAPTPAYAPSPFRPQPTGISPPPAYLGEPYQKWRPQREFYMEKLEEMRKKRLAYMPEAKPEAKPVMPAIPPTIKFGTYEVKTEYVAIGALALIIIAVVLLT